MSSVTRVAQADPSSADVPRSRTTQRPLAEKQQQPEVSAGYDKRIIQPRSDCGDRLDPFGALGVSFLVTESLC